MIVPLESHWPKPHAIDCLFLIHIDEAQMVINRNRIWRSVHRIDGMIAVIQHIFPQPSPDSLPMVRRLHKKAADMLSMFICRNDADQLIISMSAPELQCGDGSFIADEIAECADALIAIVRRVKLQESFPYQIQCLSDLFWMMHLPDHHASSSIIALVHPLNS